MCIHLWTCDIYRSLLNAALGEMILPFIKTVKENYSNLKNSVGFDIEGEAMKIVVHLNCNWQYGLNTRVLL